MLQQCTPVSNASLKPAGRFECRVYPRLSCELSGTCQPASARGSDESRWAAVVRNISQGGALLLLRRRYEPGTALALELPVLGGQEPCTIYAKVLQVTPDGKGTWTLRCQFVSA